MRRVSRHLRFAVMFLVFCASAAAQPAWMKELADSSRALTVPAKAPYLVLLEERSVLYRDIDNVRIHVRRALKINLAEQARIDAAFREVISPSIKIKNVAAWLIGPGGNKTLGDGEFAKVGAGEVSGYYEDYTYYGAMFDGVVRGDVIAYEYDIEERGWDALFNRFLIQEAAPVRRFTLECDFPEGWRLSSHVSGLETLRAVSAGERKIRWIAEDLEYRPEEPMMPDWRSLMRSIELVLVPEGRAHSTDFATWKSVADWGRTVVCKFGEWSQRSVETASADLTAGAVTPTDKVRALSLFVRDRIRYVAVEIAHGRLEPREPALTLRNSYGDCKDKSVLLCALLRAAGIHAFPALTRTGGPVPAPLPSPFHFNHCIVAIPRAEAADSTLSAATAGSWVFVDPTAETVAPGLLPAGLLGGDALVLAPSETLLTRLPKFSPAELWRTYRSEIRVKPDGSYSGHCSVINRNSYANAFRQETGWFRNTADSVNRRFSANFNGAAFSNQSITLAGDSCIISFDVSGGGMLKETGPLKLFKASPLLRDDTSPFADDHRTHDVDFGPPGLVECDAVWRFDGMKFPKLPAGDIRDSCAGYSVEQHTESGSGSWRVATRQVFTGERAPAGEYAAVKRAWATRCKIVSFTASFR